LLADSGFPTFRFFSGFAGHVSRCNNFFRNETPSASENESFFTTGVEGLGCTSVLGTIGLVLVLALDTGNLDETLFRGQIPLFLTRKHAFIFSKRQF